MRESKATEMEGERESDKKGSDEKVRSKGRETEGAMEKEREIEEESDIDG